MQSSVTVSNISKRYARSVEASNTLRDLIARPWRLFKQPSVEHFMALDNVSFEVMPGECVGILGKNGAGKSTLLKVLSRVTKPTSGRAVVRGRTASLLEVGTGFHPELSGRENILLSGSILGMSRGELRQHFDKIVEFSGVAPALDTPVKRYSSGMYLRLAFAVAAHLPAEIVFIDEILAVGDSEFQKKCFGSMREGIESGRTIFFVSHNLPMVHALCQRAIVMNSGQVVFDGPTKDAVNFYLHSGNVGPDVQRPAQKNGNATIVRASLERPETTDVDEAIFQLDVAASVPAKFAIDIRLSDDLGLAVGFGSVGFFNQSKLLTHAGKGVQSFRLGVSTAALAAGGYRAAFDLNVPHHLYLDRFDEGLAFEVARVPRDGDYIIADQAWRFGCYQVPTRLLEG